MRLKQALCVGYCDRYSTVAHLLKLERNVRASLQRGPSIKTSDDRALAMTGMAMADDGWEWPEEKPSASNCYNSGAARTRPSRSSRQGDCREDPSKRVTMVRNYSWSDDTNCIQFVPVPGVVREHVTCDIGEDKIDFHAQTPMYGAFTMALRRLYDQVDVSRSSFKVLEKKEKVIICLAKFEPPDYGTSSYVTFKPWYKLHHGCSDKNIDVTQELESERLQRVARMNEASNRRRCRQPPQSESSRIVCTVCRCKESVTVPLCGVVSGQRCAETFYHILLSTTAVGVARLQAHNCHRLDAFRVELEGAPRGHSRNGDVVLSASGAALTPPAVERPRIGRQRLHERASELRRIAQSACAIQGVERGLGFRSKLHVQRWRIDPAGCVNRIAFGRRIVRRNIRFNVNDGRAVHYIHARELQRVAVDAEQSHE